MTIDQIEKALRLVHRFVLRWHESANGFDATLYLVPARFNEQGYQAHATLQFTSIEDYHKELCNLQREMADECHVNLVDGHKYDFIWEDFSNGWIRPIIIKVK